MIGVECALITKPINMIIVYVFRNSAQRLATPPDDGGLEYEGEEYEEEV